MEEVTHVADLTKKHAETIVDTVFGSIVEALHRGEKVAEGVDQPGAGAGRTSGVFLSRVDVRCRDAAAILAGKPPRRVGVR